MEEGLKLIELSDDELKMLEWFAEWTPEIHRADWATRKSWPPGFREVAYHSLTDPKRVERRRQRLAIPPVREGLALVPQLLAHRLVEGTWHCARLAPRGRAALLHHGWPAPERFESHTEAFEAHDLRLLPDGDGPVQWEDALVEFRDKDYQGRFTLTKATASLTRVASNGTPLNGSLRLHHRLVRLTFRSSDCAQVLSATMSYEQLSELLTSSMETPVTLDFYFARDGIARSEPAPTPVSARERMEHRLKAADDEREVKLRALREKISSANIGVRLKEDLLRDLGFAMSAEPGRTFAVEQAVEEVSQALEGAVAVAQERFEIAGIIAEDLRLPAGEIRQLPAAEEVEAP
jgi:hypothetical protein